MNVYEFIYKTYNIYDLLEIYKNINSINLFSHEDTILINNYIIEKLIYNINKYYINIYDYPLAILHENDKYRIILFYDLMYKIQNTNDAFDIIIINMHNIEYFYADNIFLISTYYEKFQKIINKYSCIQLIDLFEKITLMESMISDYYLYMIYDEIVNFVFSLTMEHLTHFYTYILIPEHSDFKKIKSYYYDICWITYYIIYIDGCDDIYELCLLYKDFCNEIIYKLFKNARTNIKTLIIKKIILLLYMMPHDDILKLKNKYKECNENYFIYLLKNYDRIIYHILMLSYFYDSKIPDLLKLKTIKNLENKKNICIPLYDIKNMIYIIENIIINDIQENCINEQLMEV